MPIPASQQQQQTQPQPPQSSAPTTPQTMGVGAAVGATPGLVGALAGVLGAGLGSVVTARLVGRLLAVAGITAGAQVIAAALSLTMAVGAPALPRGAGTATQEALRAVWSYRAAYFLAAVRRLSQTPDLAAALQTERRYADMHRLAQARRIAAAKQVDHLAALYGDTLEWRARKDARTTPECWAANGKLFSTTHPPVIGWPGAAHAQCRCWATKPGPEALARGVSVDDAVAGLV